MLRRLFIATLFFCASSAAFAGTGLVEPTLKMSPQHDGKVRVAIHVLKFDAPAAV